MSGPQQLLLTSGDQLRLDAATYSRINPGGATANFVVDNDGFVYGQSGASIVQQYPWVKPASSANKYDIQWSLVSDTLPDTSPAAQNTSVNLGTDRTWQETNAATLEQTVFQIRIYPAGITVNPIVTANITLIADGSP